MLLRPAAPLAHTVVFLPSEAKPVEESLHSSGELKASPVAVQRGRVPWVNAALLSKEPTDSAVVAAGHDMRSLPGRRVLNRNSALIWQVWILSEQRQFCGIQTYKKTCLYLFKGRQEGIYTSRGELEHFNISIMILFFSFHLIIIVSWISFDHIFY